ncbi:MAG: T9SS type A sorting domain-containing protein [Flavobacteriales bacterium]|nr:T9SS type A sorting domain-containing protein [Flavobacteriales bacterium]
MKRLLLIASLPLTFMGGVMAQPSTVDIDLVEGTGGNQLLVRLRYNGGSFGEVLSNLQFTIRWPNNAATLPVGTAFCTGAAFPIGPSATVIDGGFKYRTWNSVATAQLQWDPDEDGGCGFVFPANEWVTVLTINPGSNAALCTEFQIVNDAFTAANNRNYFVSLNGNANNGQGQPYTGIIEPTPVQAGGTCSADCLGNPGGNAQVDACGVCYANGPANPLWNTTCADCLGVPNGSALPGTACNDGNPNTGNDTWQGDCTCVGQLIDCLGVPGGSALPGTACNDGNPDTGNDIWQGDCTCVGQLIDCLGVPGGSALPGTACNDGNPNTGNDTWQGDCTCVGQLIDCLGVPGGSAQIDACGVCYANGPANPLWNTTCADCLGVPNGNADIDLCGECYADGDQNPAWNTTCTDCNGDVNGTAVIDNCGNCVGGNTGEEPCANDCAGVPGGNAEVDACGVCYANGPANPLWNTTCADCLGVPNGSALPGTACNDGNPNTGNDTWQGDCTCVGQLIDCLGVPGGSALPGTACNDGNPNTGNDTWQGDCTCVGQLIDCLGVPGGSAQIDACGVCYANGPANPLWNTTCADCLGVPNGNADIDLCGECYADGDQNPAWNTTCTDCNGDVNGTAVIDNCGNCVGGNTGEEPCANDCAGVPGGNAEVDACGVCYANGPANPLWNTTCADCLGVPNGSALPGTACNDGNPNTGNDTWQGDCTCVGQLIDCLGVPGGSALPGTACNDGNPNTGNDTWQGDCTCVGQLIDCLGVPGGSAQIDACGVCYANGPANPLWNTTCADCLGVPNGNADIDLCGECYADGDQNPAWNTTCTDCNGDVNGTAVIDNCGNCVGGNTGEEPCANDCAGVPGGNAEVDACGVCYANGPANPLWNTTCADCLGVPNGSALPGTACNDGNPNTGNDTWQGDCTCVGQLIDCLGVPGGNAQVDACGVCYANGPANPLWNTTCADCLNVPNGNAEVDACGVCYANGPANPDWNTTCEDCAGVPNGSAVFDNCGNCVGGTTGEEPCANDCAGVPGGDAEVDACGVCYEGGATNPLWNTTCLDCNGDVNGTASIDDCGVCSGGDTGVEPNDCEDCNGNIPTNANLAIWTFEVSVPTTAGPHAAEGGIFSGSSQALGLHASGATAYSNPVGNGSLESFSSNNWAVGDYYQVRFPTTGHETVNIAWDQTRSATGPGSFELQWSTNGTSFSTIASYTVDAVTWSSTTPATGSSFSYPLPAGANNLPNVWVRFTSTVTTAAAGANRVDNIVASGTSLSSSVDDCGICYLGGEANPLWNTTCADCAGVPNGDSEEDECGVCYAGGDQNPAWNTTCADCAGVPNGNAYVDNCENCVGGTTGEEPCDNDCAGVPGGDAEEDACGVCYEGGASNPLWNTTCADCAGVPNGNSELDACGVCLEGGASNPAWNACVDCAGVPFGEAYIDNCENCVGGTTNEEPCANDCAGVPGGDAEEDECGVCYAGGASNPLWNSTCTDCNGVVNGTASIDDCDVCSGGDTGIEPNACADCNGNIAQEAVLANWTFEASVPTTAGPHNAEGGLFSGATSQASASHASASVAYTNPAGNGSVESFSANNWAIGDYYQVRFPTTGYEAITVGWAQTRSGTGPADFKLEWSADGTNFSALTDYTVAQVTWSTTVPNPASVFAAVSLPAGANNLSNVWVRFTSKETTAAAGTNRIDDIVVRGTTLSSSVDDCGICYLGGASNPLWNTTCADCAGVPNGTSEEDDCGVCYADGEQNPAWNSTCSDCAGVPNGNAELDECGVCYPDGEQNPAWNSTCTDCLGVVNGNDLPGQPCDDGEENTIGDAWNANCECVGVPAECVHQLVLDFETDGNGDQISWEILPLGGGAPVCSGSGLPDDQQSALENCCLPDGCYRLVVTDSGGDGIAGGGYVLRTLGGDRIIDNRGNGDFGGESALAPGEGFCLPLGTDRPIHTSCDRYWWLPGNYLVATENLLVSAQWQVGDQTDDGYEFWFFDPNGSLSFRKLRNHATGDGFGNVGATRACHIKLNNWAAASHLLDGVLYNVRVRGVVNGQALEEYGPACRVVLDAALAACPPTGLNNIPGNANYSCGVTRTFGGPNSASNRLTAIPVAGANLYEWEFRNDQEEYLVYRQTTTVQRHLNWVTEPVMEDGATYQVRVRARKGSTWCAWGWVCDVTISNNAAPGGENALMELAHPQVTLWPNPNRGDQVQFAIDHVAEDVAAVTVDIFELTGQRVVARSLPTQGGRFLATLDLAGHLAAGLYMVSISAGDFQHVERMVVQP